MARWRIGAMAVALTACGDPSAELEPEPPLPATQWGEACGTLGPHRVLDLQPGEHAYRIDTQPDDERVLVSSFFVDPTIDLADYPPTLDRAIYAVGPCGEAPTAIAHGLSLTSRFGDLSIACDDGGHGAWVIDPSGAEAPRPILDGWCPLRATDHGLLTVEAPPEDADGTLVLLREPHDAAAVPQALAVQVRTARNTYFGPGSNWTTSLWAKGERAIVLDRRGVVIEIDLATGNGAETMEGVREFRVSGDGRRMIWQSLDPTEGDPDTPVGPVFIRDLDTGQDTHLLNTHLEWTGNPYVGDYLMVRDDNDGLRVFWADDAAPIILPDGTTVRGVLDDGGLWLVRRVDGQTEELRWSPAEPSEPIVFAQHDGQVSRRGDGIEIFDSDAHPGPSEGSLSFVPFAGGEPQPLADHVHGSRGRLANDQILTIVNEDETGHGPLRLIDPQTGSWQVLDWNAYVQSPRLNASDPFDGDVVFATAGSNETPRGVYRARVAESP